MIKTKNSGNFWPLDFTHIHVLKLVNLQHRGLVMAFYHYFHPTAILSPMGFIEFKGQELKGMLSGLILMENRNV